MKHYIDFTVEDFVQDEFFIQWVLEADPSVDSFWRSWLAAHPQQTEVVQKARGVLLLLNFKQYQPAHQDYLDIWQAIEQDIEQNTDAKVVALHNSKSATDDARQLLFSGKVAASVVFALLLSAIAWWFSRPAHLHYSTDYGERKTLLLPDSSTVELNANSSLSFINDWKTGKPREVWLKGEAFFSVIHKGNDEKFLVHVDELQIEVLGTKFNVSNRRQKARVVLTSGKVKVDYQPRADESEAAGAVFMEAGEMVESRQSEKRLIKTKVDTALLTSWRHDELIFKDTPIREVIAALEDQFGIHITVQDPAVADHHYTGSIPLDNIQIFFTTISKSLNVDIMKNKHHILIKKTTRRPDP